MADGSGQTAWSYNVKGEILTEQRTIGTVSKTISYTYASDGTPSFVYYPNGNYASYGYNSAGQLTSANWVVGSTTIGFAGVSAFAPNGAVATINLDSDLGSYGEAVNYTYDVRFRPSRVQATNMVGGGTQLDLTFNYWANNSVLRVQNNLHDGRTATYYYDNLNRIASATTNATSGPDCWGQSYSYDRYGNLTAINATQCSSSTPTMSVTVNYKNQVTNSGFIYDSGGNLTSDGTYTYTWNGDNRLTTVNGVTYTYDGDGKRVQKSNGTIYWYDLSGNVLEETDASGNRLCAYIYFNGQRVGRYDPSGAHYAYLSDLIGSSVVVTDSLGHIQDSSDYYPFGGERQVTNNLPNHYKFTGMERDSETGLDHTLNRQFTSNYGRWLSLDSMGGDVTNPQSLNRYAYVLNNPTTLTDPLGLDATSYVPAIAASCNNASGIYQQICEKDTSGSFLDAQAAAANKPTCMGGEYGCGGSFTYGADFFDAMLCFAQGNTGCGGSVGVDAQGNIGFSVDPYIEATHPTLIPNPDPSTSKTTPTIFAWTEPPAFPVKDPNIGITTLSNTFPSSASNSGFSMSDSGNVNFQPGGFVCVTCGPFKDGGTSPTPTPKAASTGATSSPPAPGPPGRPRSNLVGIVLPSATGWTARQPKGRPVRKEAW